MTPHALELSGLQLLRGPCPPPQLCCTWGRVVAFFLVAELYGFFTLHGSLVRPHYVEIGAWTLPPKEVAADPFMALRKW